MPRFVRGICISGRWFYRFSHVAVQQNEVKPDGLLVLDRFRPLMRTVHKQVQVRPRFATFGDTKKHGILELPPLMQDLRGNKRLHRFTLRSKAKVDGQWKLFCLMHNLEKLAHHGYAA